MLFIENITKNFGARVIFSTSNLTINRGEKVALIGPNGSGKTTLFRMIAGLEDHDEGQIRRTGGVTFGLLAQELTPSSRPILEETLEGDPELVQWRQRRVQLNQELLHREVPDTALVEQLGEIDHRLESLGSFSAESRAGAILHGLGFSKTDQERPLDTFSGGWRMRIALARLLFSRADLLLLDEPTNHLDLESTAWLERFIQTSPTTLLIISHDRGFINRTTQVTVAIENQTIQRYSVNFERYLILRQEKLALQEKQADKQAREIEHLERFIRRFRAKATKARQVQSRVKRLEKIEPVATAVNSRHLERVRLPEPPSSAREVLTLKGIGKAFDGRSVFSQVSLRLERGHKVGLLGPNGAGKSTLLKVINQVLPADTGRVLLGDRVVTGHFAQHAMEALRSDETLMEAAERAAQKGTTTAAIRTLLGGFLFSGDDVFKTVSVLSGGEKARLALARLFLTGPNLLLLDEPTNHLDMESRLALEEGLSGYGGSMILVTHDRDLMETVCDRFWLIAQGKVREWEGDLQDYLEFLAADSANDSESRVANPSNPRDRRREAAERRKTIDLVTRPIRQRIAILEETIARLEADLERIRGQLSDPEMHAKENKERLLRLLEQNGRFESQLTQSMEEWEQLSLNLEEQMGVVSEHDPES
ncbi:MAG: ABC-F family ATP-binding cassette domain-containing protein [Magnetococcales bacterium]|nr:ABC-F family ATP-binding cassette domain-containing protein [Magnetococcales bacterium]